MKRAVVTGMIATFPVGGVAWDYGQYLLGLEQLGYEVIYLEDTGGPIYDPSQRQNSDDCAYGLHFLEQSLASLSPSLAHRWHFRSGEGECFGIPLAELEELVTSADLLLNVSGSTLLRDEYMGCPSKVLIDTDPGWNQFVNYPRWDAWPGWLGTHGYRAHDHFFTYAERLGQPDCNLPDMGLTWHPTRPPVALDRWQPRPPGNKWTTVMTWNTYRQPLVYEGKTYGSKEMEFGKIEGIPKLLPEISFEVASGGRNVPIDHWQQAGWNVIDSHNVSATLDDYRDYVERSRGELSIAKNVYAATRSGWFSCRSACYLAASRPVVVQDTGFSDYLPTGEGVLVFNTEEEARAALSSVESAYELHQRRAREIAQEYFDAKKVLGELLEGVGQR